MHLLDLRFDGKQLCDRVLRGYLKISRSPLKIVNSRFLIPYSSLKLSMFSYNSLFPLKTGERNFRFLFLLSKLEKRILISLPLYRRNLLASRQGLI